ncbi:hypothetical protein D3C85_1287610 [compost metagenome]
MYRVPVSHAGRVDQRLGGLKHVRSRGHALSFQQDGQVTSGYFVVLEPRYLWPGEVRHVHHTLHVVEGEARRADGCVRQGFA